MEGLYLKIRTLIVICLLMVSLIPGSGCIDSSSEPVKEAKLDEVTDSQDTSSNTTVETAHEENFSEESKATLESEKKSSFFGYYSKRSLQFEADVPPYPLPLKASEIANYEDFSQKIPLTNDSRNLLYKNGFVVIESGAAGLFEAEPVRVNETYKDLKVADVPIFITSDSLLHLYNIQFDETLKRVEEKEFYNILWKLDKALLEASIEDYNRSIEDKASEEVIEASRRNVVYFAVALSLLEPKPEQIEEKPEISGKNFYSQDAKQYNVEIPSFVKTDVETELRLIEAQEGSVLSPIFNYDEDYSQYTPRGHYTSSEKLKNYFKAMMWHGRISMLLQPGMITAKELTTEDSVTEKSAAENSVAEKSEKETIIQTIQALLISDHLNRDRNLQAEWDIIYDVTAFYVGFSDDLGPYEYAKALDIVFGNNREGINFDNKNLTALKAELERYESPKIYSGTGAVIYAGSETENKTLEATKGFRFMGQRYTPDSYILQNLNPPALNIMDLLGSERAKEHLKNLDISENEEYKERHLSLENEFEAFDEEDWDKNLYWAQLYALKPLLVSYPEGYPTFMQTEAWEDKQLNTALASWTELRHDTILYAKQAYFVSAFYDLEEKPVQGYVEPVPEFYARMLALTKMAHSGLAEMEVLDEQSDKDFTTLESTLEKLLEISIKELENKELTDEEYEFIKSFEKNIAPMLENIDEDAQSSVVVADVYTDQEGRVLEEGTGKLDLLIVAYKQPDGRIVLGAGPVMSYYEFWQPSGERLTDEEWREMLENN
ncbi:dTDP-glucose 4,6-dehydratase, partial [Methanosarcina mazei]